MVIEHSLNSSKPGTPGECARKTTNKPIVTALKC